MPWGAYQSAGLLSDADFALIDAFDKQPLDDQLAVRPPPWQPHAIATHAIAVAMAAV